MHARGIFLILVLTLAAGALAPAARAAPPDSAVGAQVQYAHGRLTVSATDVPLADLLQKVARATGLEVVFDVRPEGRTSLSFRDLPLDESLRRILRGRNFAFEYARPGVPAKLWIFSGSGAGKDSPRGREIGPPPERASEVQSPQPDLTAEEPSTRGAAVEALGDSGRAEAVEPLRQALRDEDEQVRESAIMALAGIGTEEAIQALGIALRDQAPWLREVAVTALGQFDSPAATQLLRQALSDSDEGVRQAAAAVLEQQPR